MHYTGLHLPEIVQGGPLIVCPDTARSHLPVSDTSDAPFPFFSFLTVNGVLVLVCDPVPEYSTPYSILVVYRTMNRKPVFMEPEI